MEIEPRKSGIRFNLDIGLGSIISIIVFLVTFAIAWTKFDARLSTVEKWQMEHEISYQTTFDKMNDSISKLNTTIDLLEQRLTDYRIFEQNNKK